VVRPRRGEAGNLVAVAEQTEADGVAFVGVNVKDDATPPAPSERKQGVPYRRCTTSRAFCSPASAASCRRSHRPRCSSTARAASPGASSRVTETELLGPVQVLAGERV
jgi:hypothetical protein